MNPELKTKLHDLGLNDEQVGKLEAEGVNTIDDLKLLTAEEIKNTADCNTVVSRKVHAYANPPAVSPTPPPASGAPIDAEIPEGKSPSPEAINSFAAGIGMDPSILSMMLLSGTMGSAGMGSMDISGIVPIPTIVAGYNPKIRNMFMVIMGQLEQRLGCPIVVIDDDGTVNKKLTEEYIVALEEGFAPAENDIHVDEGGAPREIISVGVDAKSVYDADPLDSSRAMNSNGLGIGRVNWKGTTLEVRQMAFFAVQQKEIDPTNEEHLNWLRENIKPATRRLVFQGRAPKAVAAFNAANRIGTLPTLRVMLSKKPRRPEFMPRRRSGAPRDLSSIAGPRRGPEDAGDES